MTVLETGKSKIKVLANLVSVGGSSDLESQIVAVAPLACAWCI